MKKLLIAIAILIVIALLGLGAAYYTGNLELPFGLALASPTPVTVALPVTPESVEAASPTPAEGPAELTEEVAEAGELATSESATSEPEATPAEAGEANQAASAETEPTPTPVMALPSATPTPVVTPVPTATPTPRPTVTPLITQTPVQAEPPADIEKNLVPTPSTGQMTGEWDYNFGTMSLTQSGVSVSGVYHWYGGANQGRITGSFVYNTNQFRGLWIDQINPSEQGFLDWRLSNGQSFSGTFENNSQMGQWCGVRTGQAMPPGCGFSGFWHLHFGSPGNVAGQATVTQIGSRVSGTYSAADGRSGEIVEATITVLSITEAILRGTWRNTTGESGPFEWRLNQTTNQTFMGRRLDDNSEWCGWREGAARPESCGF